MELLMSFSVFAFLVACFGLSALILLSWLTPWPERKRKELLQKMFEFSPSGVQRDEFPSVLRESPLDHPQHTPPSLYLSVVVPAMNEQERLPSMLDECLAYLEARTAKDDSFTFEIIIVDDGSTDSTSEVAFLYKTNNPGLVKVLKLERNLGKGGAVRNGVLRCRGAMILFVDADGATRFSDFERVEEELLRSTTADDSVPNTAADFDWTFPAIAVGSRAYMEAESIARRSIARTILMLGFHALVYIFTVRTVRDTQCGFKLFTRAAAAKLFPILHIERWAFDVELLYLAERFHYPIREVPVGWHEVDGSKIVPFWSWLQMGRDLLLIWFRYTTGIWKADVSSLRLPAR